MISDVYLLGDLLVLPAHDEDEQRVPMLAPDAGPALRNLLETGHRVAIVGDRAIADLVEREIDPAIPVVGEVAADAAGWLLVGDPHECQAHRPSLRTILVGPRRPAGVPPARRCDAEARDLADAVLAILAREVMPGA